MNRRVRRTCSGLRQVNLVFGQDTGALVGSLARDANAARNCQVVGSRLWLSHTVFRDVARHPVGQGSTANTPSIGCADFALDSTGEYASGALSCYKEKTARSSEYGFRILFIRCALKHYAGDYQMNIINQLHLIENVSDSTAAVTGQESIYSLQVALDQAHYDGNVQLEREIRERLKARS